MIVPVWVPSAANPYKEKLVYALLDTQSDTAFIDEEVQMDVCPVRLKLTTMMGENVVVNSEKVSGLRVGVTALQHTSTSLLRTQRIIYLQTVNTYQSVNQPNAGVICHQS